MCFLKISLQNFRQKLFCRVFTMNSPKSYGFYSVDFRQKLITMLSCNLNFNLSKSVLYFILYIYETRKRQLKRLNGGVDEKNLNGASFSMYY